jgi:hypothetical protein
MSGRIVEITSEPDGFTAVFEPDERFELQVTIKVTRDEDGRPFHQSLLAEAPDDEHPVTALNVRAIPVRELVREAMAMRRVAEKGHADELRVAAEVHALATKAGEDPLRAVARALGVGRTTAANRVHDARQAGLLPPRRRRLSDVVDDDTAKERESGAAPPRRRGRLSE